MRDRMVGRLSDLETRGYLFLVGKAIKSSIPFTLDKPREGEVSIDLVEVQSRVRPRVEEGQLIIQVEIEADGDLSELVAVGLSVDPN